MEKIKELNYILPWDIKFNNGNCIQFGKISGTGAHKEYSLTFPIAYTKSCIALGCGYRHSLGSNVNGTVHIYSLSLTKLSLEQSEAGAAGITAFYWICIGN